MIKVLINGCNGKMGQEVAKEIDNHENLVLIGGFDIKNTGLFTFPVYTDYSEIEEKPDVIIDFSIPIATLNILEYARQEKIPTVVATTGFKSDESEKIESYASYIPIFKANNMSYDINLMSKTVANLAKHLSNTDIEIIESHHNRKIDAPSGTAITLADSINRSLGNSMEYIFDRHSRKEKRQKNEIGFSSIRGGNIVGEHTVMFIGEHESFEIKHTSFSRSVYADGACKAAEFLVTKDAGLYSMDDLVGE